MTMANIGATFFDPLSTIAETDDVLKIELQNDAGEMIKVNPATHTLTVANLQNARVDMDIMSDAPAEVRVLSIEGSIVNLDGTPAPGLSVTIRLNMGGAVTEKMPTTDAAGEYTA